jgi:hypothetical protein
MVGGMLVWRDDVASDSASSRTRQRRSRTVRLLARAAWHQDTGVADARARCQWSSRCRLAGATPQSAAGLLSGLRSHPQYELASRQMQGFGG